ncbi:unnamed protein product [Cochlearia groenlandica]
MTEESLGGEEVEFKWGKKRGTGGKNKDIQFYESFTYEGEEYSLYDSVLVADASDPDSAEPFIGMIIKIWERTNKNAKVPRQVKLLWFFKPSEISDYLEGVSDVLSNELFLASGEGLGLANVNQLEAIGGKCSVLCISQDKRNPQPTEEEINATDFVFRRAFDVGSHRVVDTIDDKIAGVDAKFIFNRAGCKRKATVVPKIEGNINGHPDSLKPNGLLATGSVRKTEDNSTESSDIKESSYGHKEENEKDHNKLATTKTELSEEKCNKDSGVQERTIENEHNSCEASDSRGNHCDGKAQGSEVRSQYTKQKSMPTEERDRISCEASGSREKLLTKQKSMPAEGRYSKDLNGCDDRPQKKQKLDGYATVSEGRDTNMSTKISSDSKKDIESFKRPRDKVAGDEFKKRDLGVSVSEGKDTDTATEKSLFKKPSSDGKLLKRSDEKMFEDDYKRNYQVIEVSQRPETVKSKWFRPLPWEESMREAEKEDRLVLFQNLDPSYTSDEVQNIVYSALNEQCTARMIECTSITTSHTCQALVIFNSREAAERAVRRLDEGCLLLSNGWPLVAVFPEINPPGKPSSFHGHIKLQKTQMRRETRDAVATSHCSQPNTLEFEMAMEWCLHRARFDQTMEAISKRQLEEKNQLRINFTPKQP